MSDDILKQITAGIPKEYLISYEDRNNSEYYKTKNLEWANLPYTEKEIKIASEIFNDKNIIYYGPKVSEERIKYLSETGVLKKAGIILFSTHGYMEKDNPNMSALVLTQTDKLPEKDLKDNKIVDDGYLNADEVLNLKLGSPLIILSACETGKGKVESGEGVAGLSQSFFLAGANHVLATLWSIGDESTQVFMKIFLTKIKEGLEPYKALNETKKIFRKENPEYNSPFYWAAFVLYGAM